MTESNGELRINLEGRYGNQLFMYFNARIFAEKNRLNLITNKPDGVLNIIDNKYFGVPTSNINKIIIKDDSYNSNQNCYNYEGLGNYFFEGYFQIEDIIYENLDLIKSWIKYDIDKKNIATLHIRLGDFYFADSRHLIVSQDYYIDCIKKYCNDYNDIYIICDSIKEPWENLYMELLKQKIKDIGKNPIYNSQSIKDDYQNIIDSTVIITSNSTFCFWPMVLSNADKIISYPYFAIDVNIDNSLGYWGGIHKVFKYNKNNKYIFNNEYNKDIINYFENMDKYRKYIVYYINLKSDNERNIKIKNQLDNFKIMYERIEGVNGYDLEIKNLMNIICNNIVFSRGQMGCYLSHKKCYELFLKTNNKYLIILEDDVILKENFKNNLDKLFLFLDNNSYIDFVYLSRSTIIMENQETPLSNKYSDEFIYSPQTCGYGFHSYLLTKNGANKLLTILNNSEKDTFDKNNAIPVDCLDTWKILGERINIEMNIFALKNEITFSDNEYSNTSQII